LELYAGINFEIWCNFEKMLNFIVRLRRLVLLLNHSFCSFCAAVRFHLIQANGIGANSLIIPAESCGIRLEQREAIGNTIYTYLV